MITQACRFFVHPALPARTRSELLALAEQPGNDTWQPGTPLSEVRHCHYTNTPEQMRRGLTESHNFLEGDISLEAAARRIPGVDHWREPIMAHDPQDTNGLTLDEWLTFGKASGKGLKLDIKQAAALPKILELVHKHDIPDEYLIFNADVTRGPGAAGRAWLTCAQVFSDKTMGLDDLRQIRAEFPDALISLGAYTGKQPDGTTYSPKHVEKLQNIAQSVGGPISFPLRAEFVSPAIVQALKPFGSVSIWNDPSTFSPGDVAQATQRFRDMGVDGIIDLRNSAHKK